MPETTPVYIPLINPNEPEARITALHIQPGERVQVGQTLCDLETTKATQQINAEIEGFVVGLQFEAGQTGRAGDLLCYLADSPDWTPPDAPARDELKGKKTTPAGLRITQPALALAREHALDLSQLPVGPLVTEKIVSGVIAGLDPSPEGETHPQRFDPTAIVVYGGGGHGKAVIDMLLSLGTYQIVGVLDDGIPPGDKVMGFPILGGGDFLPTLREEGVRLAVNAVGGIGNITIRVAVFHNLARAGFICPPVVHPTAFVEASASMAAGVQVFPHAYVGSEVQVGEGVIVNTGAIVSHECILESYSNVSPGAILAGDVRVGPRCLIGMGTTVNLGVRIGAGSRVGNGATVIGDVPENGIVRAGSTWSRTTG
jgi:sugar O-acyltransferase (sialic acid O-acetyltransferase NeuD family)